MQNSWGTRLNVSTVVVSRPFRQFQHKILSWSSILLVICIENQVVSSVGCSLSFSNQDPCYKKLVGAVVILPKYNGDEMLRCADAYCTLPISAAMESTVCTTTGTTGAMKEGGVHTCAEGNYLKLRSSWFASLHPLGND